MKRITLVICISILISSLAGAQTLAPEKSTIEHHGHVRSCWLVKLDPEPKTLKKAWINFCKEKYDFKLKGMTWFSNKDMLYAEEVSIERLSSKKMNFYTYVTEDENGSEMKVFASLGYDIYLNQEQYPIEFEALNEMMITFLKQYLPEYYNEKIDETAARVKSLNKEIKNLNGDIQDNRDNIEKLNREIEKYENSLEDNSKKLKTAETKLIGRQEKLERVKTKLKQL